MYRKILLFSLILLCLIFTLSSCWDAREINTLVIILGLGIDPVKNGYEITIQSPVTESAPAQTGQAGSQSKFQVISSRGRTIFEAARNLTTILSRRNYWPHTGVVVLNNVLSQYGFQHAIDYFARDAQRRRQTYFVLTDQTAKRILSVKPPVESFTPTAIEHMIENTKRTGYGVSTDLNLFLNQIQTLSGTSLLNFFTLVKEEEIASGQDLLDLAGTAVIYQYQVTGYLTPTETRAVNIIHNKLESGTFIVNLKGDGQNDLTLGITHILSKLTPEKVGDSYLMKVSLFIKCNIVEYTGTENMMDLPLDGIESHTAATIESEIQQVFQKATKEIKADFLLFGNLFKKIAPELRTINQDDWNEIFQTSVKLEVKANIEINSAGVVLNHLH